MFQLSASVTERRTRKRKFSTSSRRTTSGTAASAMAAASPTARERRPLTGRTTRAGGPPAPPRERQVGPADQEKGEREARQAHDRHRQPADGEDGTGIARGDRALVRREETHGRRLERQRQPEADEEGVLDTRLLGCAHDPPEERPVEDDAGDERGGDDDRERREGVESPEREEPEGAVAAEHDQLAVGDVEHLEDAEDQGEAGGGEPVEPAEEEPEDQLLEERAHGAKGPR